MRQQFYWPQSYISLQGSSISLAFVQILFGGEGASSSVLHLKLTFGHPQFSPQSWRMREEREAGNITTDTSVSRCHHHCLKSNLKNLAVLPCAAPQDQVLCFLWSSCPWYKNHDHLYDSKWLRSQTWNLIVCIISLLKGSLQAIPRPTWVFSAVHAAFSMGNLDEESIIRKIRV